MHRDFDNAQYSLLADFSQLKKRTRSKKKKQGQRIYILLITFQDILSNVKLIKSKSFKRFKIFQLFLSQMKKNFLIEKFITIIILLRSSLSQIPFWVFSLIVIAFYYAKYRKQGYTYTIVGFMIGTFLALLGEITQWKAVYLSGLGVMVIANFIPHTVHYIPIVKPFVGFSQETIASGLYVCQFYPLKEQPKPKVYFRKWASEKEFQVMYQNFIASMPVFSFIKKPIFDILMSYVEHYRVYFGIGVEQSTQELIIFSPGRGSTPLFYSNLLMNLAKKRKVVTLQHTDQTQNPFRKDLKQAKKFRQEEVLKRALELVEVFELYAQSSQYKRIILAGHSYGGATLFCAYEMLKKKGSFEKIKELIMLDPWFFPLTENMVKVQSNVPILILGNQFEVIQHDFHQQNTNFSELHVKTQYQIFSEADHLHQTDLPFIMGNNPFIDLKLPQKGFQMIQKNVKVIENFINKRDVKDGLKQKDFVSKDWKVPKSQKNQKIKLFYL